MAYIYKTVMRAENHDFDICQNRKNSKETHILAMSSYGSTRLKFLGVIKNKTNEVIIDDTNGFSEKTIKKLKERLK